jgi:hypothetical protein
MIKSTRLRVIRSKELALLLAGINNLSYKIEIKGGPVKDKGKWHVFFVLPDQENPLFKKIPLIMDID